MKSYLNIIAQLPFKKIVLVSLKLLNVCNFDFVLNSNGSQNPVVLFLISEAPDQNFFVLPGK
jgi:hypothetical protein